MSAPQRFQDEEYKNWVKCSLALVLMKEGLHDYVDTGVKKLHLHIKQNLTSTPGGPSIGKICGFCTSKDIKKAGSNPITWNIKCRSSVCDRWLSQILAVHNEPNNHGINWKNADISRWPTDPYEIAKVYMPKGQDRTHNNLPQELDAPAVLSLLKYCTLFRTRIPNVQLLSDLIDFRNDVLHSGELKVLDSKKDICIDKMIQLLSDLNVNGSAQSELNRIKCEDIDVSFRENEIQALQNLVSGLGSKLAKVTGEMTSLQNVQIQQSEETTKRAEEVKKSLQELKEIYDKMESFLNKNPDISDIEITRNMTDFKNSLQEELSLVREKVLLLENDKKETQLQLKGVERRLAALEEKSGNNIQPIHQKVITASGGATASSSSDGFCTESDGPVDDISSLRPYQKRSKIRARVTNKSRITPYKKYGKWNQRLNVSFADLSGSINAVAFGETADKFDDLLKEHKVYYVTNATIQPAKKKFGGNANDMILNDDTIIQLYEEEDSLALPSQIPFNSVMIDKLKPGRSYDVIGVVKDHGEKRVKRWNGIELQIVDQSKKMVPLNLSKKDVENLDLRGNPVVAVNGAWLTNSHGHVYLKMMPNSKVRVNPADLRETDPLHSWFEREGRQIDFEKI